MSIKGRIETVLFVSGKAVTIEEIAEILKEEPQKIESELLDLILDYSSKDSALEIDDEDGYIIQVRDEYQDIVEKLVPVELKPAVLKTLSIIAIKQPIRQTQLKELRGAVAYDHIPELIEKGLITRKKDKNGRSYMLKTTPKFGEYFKLKGDTKALSKILDLNKDSIVDKTEESIEEEIEDI
jgi:segregation and condensation protein B